MLAQGDTFLEPSRPKMSPKIDFSLIFHTFWGSKMHQKSIQKQSNFQTSLETLFSANRVHKSSKMRVQNHSKIQSFLGRVKNRESCSRLHADLVFEVQSTPKSHFCSNHFRELSLCCPGTVAFQISNLNEGPNSIPKWLKNGVKSRIKNEQIPGTSKI